MSGQWKVAEKANEIAAIPLLLDSMDEVGSIITMAILKTVPIPKRSLRSKRKRVGWRGEYALNMLVGQHD